jgi:pSer/pThr/pTyr-binding forkhead associated (FHA) protein
MTSYFVGRSPNADRNRIVISDLTVSGRHCTLAVLEGGTCEIVDNNSTNGTFVRVKGSWQRISKATVRDHDEVRLGAYITTVAELMRQAEPQPPAATATPPPPARTRFERNPETGEIVIKPES